MNNSKFDHVNYVSEDYFLQYSDVEGIQDNLFYEQIGSVSFINYLLFWGQYMFVIFLPDSKTIFLL